MIRDNDLIFSAAQVATDCTGASDNVIDMTKAGDAVAGAELYLVVRVGTALDTGADGTLQIALESDSVEDFTTQSTKKTHVVSEVFAETALTADKIIWKLKLPPGLQRFVRLYYTESVDHAFTSGTLDAFLTPDVNIA